MKKIFLLMSLILLNFAYAQNNPQASQVPQRATSSDSTMAEKITSEESVRKSDAVKTADHHKVSPAKAASDTVRVRKGKKK